MDNEENGNVGDDIDNVYNDGIGDDNDGDDNYGDDNYGDDNSAVFYKVLNPTIVRKMAIMRIMMMMMMMLCTF